MPSLHNVKTRQERTIGSNWFGELQLIWTFPQLATAGGTHCCAASPARSTLGEDERPGVLMLQPRYGQQVMDVLLPF
jgi:hypothetical protein